MHVVLDGEATSDERRALESALERNPVARSEFDELRRLFDAMKAVPQAFPPEGLVAAVLADARKPGSGGDSSQPFRASRVFEPNSKKSQGRPAGQGETVYQASKPWALSRGDRMNQQKIGFSGKRKLLVGGGIAAAAIIVALSTGVFPPGGNDIAGTIVPAERYRAPQITADDVKVGNQATGGGTNTATSPAPGPALNGQGATDASAGLKGGAVKSVVSGTGVKGNGAESASIKGNEVNASMPAGTVNTNVMDAVGGMQSHNLNYGASSNTMNGAGMQGNAVNYGANAMQSGAAMNGSMNSHVLSGSSATNAMAGHTNATVGAKLEGAVGK